MWAYPGRICPNRPFYEELSVVEVDARIHRVLDLGVNPTPRAGPIPLRRGIASARVSTLGPVSVTFAILSFNCACDLAQGPRGSHGEPWDADLLVDATRLEARHATGEETWARERERGMPPDGQ
jgi:hypothetical protein